MKDKFVVKRGGLYLANAPGIAGKVWTPRRADATCYQGECGLKVARSHAKCYDGKIMRLTKADKQAAA